MLTQQAQLFVMPGALSAVLANGLAATPAPGPFKTSFLGLASALPGAGSNPDPATVVECTYDGYARLPVVWGEAGIDSEGRAAVHAEGVLFSPAGTTQTDIARGAVLYDAVTGGNLNGFAQFAEPITMASPDDDVTVVVVLAFPDSALNDYGSAVAIN